MCETVSSVPARKENGDGRRRFRGAFRALTQRNQKCSFECVASLDDADNGPCSIGHICSARRVTNKALDRTPGEPSACYVHGMSSVGFEKILQ